MREEMTEITMIHPRTMRSPSLLANMMTLILLFGLVAGSKYLSDRWLIKTPIHEIAEDQIVMEDLDNEKPLAEGTAVMAIPTTPTPEPVAVTAPTPEPEKTPEMAAVTPTKKKTAKKKAPKKSVAVKKVIPVVDPYNSGGEFDLDNRGDLPQPIMIKSKVDVKTGETISTTPVLATPRAPLPQTDERDQMIPFESQ